MGSVEGRVAIQYVLPYHIRHLRFLVYQYLIHPQICRREGFTVRTFSYRRPSSNLLTSCV